MEKTWRNRSWHLGNALENSNSSKAPNQKDRRSSWERRDYSRERKVVRWIKELTRQTTRPWSSWATFNLSVKSQRENILDESDGSRAQHVLGSSQRVQVRNWTSHSRTSGDETTILRAETPWVDLERGLNQSLRWLLRYPISDWSLVTLYWRWIQSRHLSGFHSYQN